MTLRHALAPPAGASDQGKRASSFEGAGSDDGKSRRQAAAAVERAPPDFCSADWWKKYL